VHKIYALLQKSGLFPILAKNSFFFIFFIFHCFFKTELTIDSSITYKNKHVTFLVIFDVF